MFRRGRDIYRSKALDRLSSPESLDQLMIVVSARDWIPLLTISAGLALVFAWSLVGNIETAATARNVLIYPSKLVEIQAELPGRLESLAIRPGMTVHHGDIIGTIDQSAIRAQLEQDRIRLADLRSQDTLQTTLRQYQSTAEQQEIAASRRVIQLQDASLTRSLEDARTLAPALQRRFDSYNRLRDEGLIADASESIVASQQAIIENKDRIGDLIDRLDQLESQNKQLDTREASIASGALETSTTRANSILELESRIALNELQLRRNSEIRSPETGRIVELVTTSGQVLAAGARIATLEREAPDTRLTAISFFPVSSGKRIKPGMSVQVTPDSVERQRFGGIVGQVFSVSALPVTKVAAEKVVGNPELAESMMAGGPYIQVMSSLETSANNYSGYRWSSSSGPDLQITPGMTGSTRVIIEGRSPITYVFPFLRSLSGAF